MNAEKGVFKCFHKGCRQKRQGGDVLELVRAIEGCGLREAGERIAGWFAVAERAAATRAASKKKLGCPDPEVINPPLGFELKSLDREAGERYALKRGLSDKTVVTFDLAVATAGMFKGRLVIALHDEEGELVGYAGRSLDGSEPKYLFPSSEKGFYKSHLLFNLHRVLKDQQQGTVVLVEGFFDCMVVSQAVFPALGLMGSSLSEQQTELLATHFRHVVVVLDGDEAGRKATEECLVKLGRRVYVRAVELPEGQAPVEIREALRY